MVVLHGVRETEATFGAVEEVVASTDSTQATVTTVKLSLQVIIKETASFTKISAKFESTFGALVADLCVCERERERERGREGGRD